MANPNKEREDRLLLDDAIDMLCGQLLGVGMSRDVFDCNLMPGYVVKVERTLTSMQNYHENQVWQSVMYGKFSAWFAQVHSISTTGRILIMEKTVTPRDDEWPPEIPAFFTDIKRENFGISMLTDQNTGVVSKRFVCHDYGVHLLLQEGQTRRMQKVNWMELER